MVLAQTRQAPRPAAWRCFLPKTTSSSIIYIRCSDASHSCANSIAALTLLTLVQTVKAAEGGGGVRF